MCLFLGWVGAHKFYLGQTSAGVLYLIFSFTGIPFVISFVELIILIIMSEDEFNGRYNNSTTNTGRQNVVVNINTDTSVTERKDKIDDVKGDITKQIEELDVLRQKGLITNDEFTKKKEKILRINN
ncbi:uncharacterized protein METZ01_LOCUS417271 [marine metagenome]|uniref:TM2 domain-containing protein n=1 Tax=marine metagenome TaxID=408172 RepID=A0A382WZS2_9ZZZZ